MNRRRIAFAGIAALAGIVILSVWFGKYWPGRNWTAAPRSELIEKGRAVAKDFGLDVSGWNAYAVATVAPSLTHYAHEISPLSLHITFASPKGKHAAEVGFNSDGALQSWRAPEDEKLRTFSSGQAAAVAAFQLVAGTQAARYTIPTKPSVNDDDELEFEFKKGGSPKSGLRDRIMVRTKDSAITRAERKVTPLTDDLEEEDSDEGYWGVLGALNGLIYTVGLVVLIGIFLLWMMRKALNRRFPLRFAGAALIIMLVVAWAGSGWDRSHSVHLEHEDDPHPPVILAALAVLLYTAVGRGISVVSRPKWMALEQLCRLAPVARQTGHSIQAGMLFSPLLVAIPYLVVGCGLFPQSWIWPDQAEILYSRAPLIDSLTINACAGLLFFFGFLLPAFRRLVPASWLAWPLLLPVGTIFFAIQTRSVSGPVAAPLVAGLLTFALFSFVWAQFDLLAIFTLQLSSGLILGLLILGQKGHTPVTFVMALGCLVVAAVWCVMRGQPEATGDPLATNPAVTGFRAEREKLIAEFSVARRAQQDMLPQTAPSIPGYSIAASCTPSLEVGGDLYDFLRLKDGRIGIGVADVSGKGVPAALYMTLTKGLLSAVTKSSSELAGVVEEVNRHLHGVTRKKVFVTMVLGFLDAEKRVLQCARAGHNPMVWRQKDKQATSLVAPGGLGLGITASRVFATQLKVQDMQLSEGDAVVFYSDGITEAMNRHLDQFGEQRLMDAVERTDHLDATAAHDSILLEVRQFLDGVHPQDDMTLVVLRVGDCK